MIDDLELVKASGRGKEHWKFSVTVQNPETGWKMKVSNWKYWPDSGDVKPPIFFSGPKQLWFVTLDEEWRLQLKGLVEKFIAARGSVVVDSKRAWSDEDIENSVIKVFCSGDRDVLERFMNLTPEKARSINAEVPTQADKEFVLRRLKEVVDGAEE